MNDESDSVIQNVSVYAEDESSSPFDVVLPEQAVQPVIKHDRIVYSSFGGATYTVPVTRKCLYHQTLFHAFAAGLQTGWLAGLSEKSKLHYFDACRKFSDWLIKTGYSTTDTNRYRCLKDYETFCMNEMGLKRSPLGHINQILKEGLGSTSLSDSDHNFIETLLHLSKPAGHAEAEQVTLSDWFALPWLRSILGERSYLQLESPSRLFSSFRVTIAVTLLHLLDMRWQRHQLLPVHAFKPDYKLWPYDWNRLLMQSMAQFDSLGEPSNDFTHSLWIDLVKPSCSEILKNRIAGSGIQDLKRRYVHKGKHFFPWQKPVVFHPNYQTAYSALEERLLGWLAACEAIQPGDIPKLKTTDYAREVNASGRLIAMECSYYKGRSGRVHRPGILLASDTWTQALYRYVENLPHGTPLFQSAAVWSDRMPALGEPGGLHNPIGMLFKLWKTPGLQKRIRTELKRAQTTPLFLRAMLALEKGSGSANQLTKKGMTVAECLSSVPRPPPPQIFSPTHIKNTAVHAGSDNYREADLINHHSHSTETEKHSYLTDANKDFVNRAGRATRLVLHDLQNVVYQPSIAAMQHAVNDLEMRTRLTEATGITDVVLHSLEQQLDQDEAESRIVVPDTSDNALYFVHYLKQAELMLPRLLAVRPDWVERTLIVQVEWMTRTLSRMRHAKTAQKQYITLQAHLPQLFDHLLETVE